jgi:hypothetical protein
MNFAVNEAGVTEINQQTLRRPALRSARNDTPDEQDKSKQNS